MTLTTRLGHVDLHHCRLLCLLVECSGLRAHDFPQQLVSRDELRILHFQVLGIAEIGTSCHDDDRHNPEVAEVGLSRHDDVVLQLVQARGGFGILHSVALEAIEIGCHCHVLHLFSNFWEHVEVVLHEVLLDVEDMQVVATVMLHQCCRIESIDSESGVFVKSPAIYLWELFK